MGGWQIKSSMKGRLGLKCVCGGGGGIYANSTVQLEIIEESQRDCLEIFS